MSDQVFHIKRALGKFASYLISDPVRDPEDLNNYIIFVDPTPKFTGQRQLSKYHLKKQLENIKLENIKFTIHVSKNDKLDLLESIKFTVFQRHDIPISNIFINETGPGFSLWVETKGPTDDRIKQKIVDALEKATLQIIHEIPEITFSDLVQKPTSSIIMRIVRTHAPVTAPELCALARREGFEVPGTIWMRRELRKLKKKKFVVQCNAKEFALTAAALQALGSRKNRNSPDIKRALALARKGG